METPGGAGKRENAECRMLNAELRCGEGLATFIFLGCFILGFSV